MIEAALAPRGMAELQADLRRIQGVSCASECFDAVFELSGALVGSQRRLEVIWQGKAAVWKSEGSAWLPGDEQSMDICVRGSVVGTLKWPGTALRAVMKERLEMLVQLSGMVLLERALRLPEAAQGATDVRNEPNKLAQKAARSETRAERFASLLIEDLRLFLTRERAEEFATGLRYGDWQLRFAPELERCRSAFRSRYGEAHTFEEVVPRLAELPG